MGQRLSAFMKSSKSAPEDSQLENERIALPSENLMLQQIHEDHTKASKATERRDFESDASQEQDHSLNCKSKSSVTDSGNSETRELIQQLMLDHILKKQGIPEETTESSNEFCTALEKSPSLEENDSLEDDLYFSFIDFPDLVVQRLLMYLNPPAILALRATCTATKAWIDNNSYILRDMQVRIEPELCKYHYKSPHTAPWSNFAIPFVHLQSVFVQDTIDNYADQIWNLEIFAPKSLCSAGNYPSNHPRRMFDLISRCTRLQRLVICRFDTLTQLPADGSACFQSLRVLSIDRIQWMNNSDFALFEQLIMNCPLLEYLKVPEFEILGSLAFMFYERNSPPEKEYLIRPLIRYLDRYRRPPINGESLAMMRRNFSKLYIDVAEFEDFKLCSSEIFYELSRACIISNAVLMNVYFVPRDAVLRNEQNIVESFASMFGFIKIDFRAELWKNLEVMECWIEEFPDDLDLTIKQFEFLQTVAKIETLRSLTIRMSVDNPDICSGALEACVGQTYTGIRKLILRRHQVLPDTVVRIPPGFGNSFQNLKCLYFQEMDAPNEDFQALWPALPNLEELFVYKCPHLTQKAFIGSNEQPAPLLSLQKLKILVIFLYDGFGGFNDDFMVKCLRYMKLKGFALRGATGVEFTDKGMLSLLNSPFHDTIEDFEAPSTCFRPTVTSNYWSFYIALPKKELQRNRIWLSCSVLLNSLTSRKHPYDFKRKCLGI